MGLVTSRVGLAALLSTAVAWAACEGPAVESGKLVATVTAPRPAVIVDAPRDAGAGDPDAGAAPSDPDGSADDYGTMCRHYCQALEETLFYACLSSGRTPDECLQQAGGITGQCFELRCAPHRVQPSLCPVQCDALAHAYETICGESRADPALCPSPPADHDKACRAGCSTYVPTT